MPSFASWAWPKANLAAIDDVLRRIEHVEQTVKWEDKIDKVVWRGTPWFNPIGHTSLRQDLLKATKGKAWADVEALSTVSNTTNSIKIEDFCRFKYVVYTEGVTYSGRLPYHQACASVLITAPITWLTASGTLLRPIAAAELRRRVEQPAEKRAAVPRSEKMDAVPGALPTVATWQEANAIYVKPDFSDLEGLVRLLRLRPDVASRIARNQREFVVRGGYLSLAAETCYWRALVRGWAAVAQVDGNEWSDEVGVRYEEWLLEEVGKRRDGTRGRVEGIGG